MTPEGTEIAVEIPKEPRGNFQNGLAGPSTLGVLVGGHFTPVAQSVRETVGAGQGHWRQITAAMAVGDRIFWSETASTDLEYSEWAIRSVDRRGGRITEIAHSPRLADRARLIDVVGGTYPVVIGDWVYWATADPVVARPSPRKRSDWNFIIEGKPFDSTVAPVVVARNAVFPAAADGKLFFATYSEQTPNVYEIRALAGGGARGTPVNLARGFRSGSSWITGLAAGGHWIVWRAQSPDLEREGWVAGETAPGHLFVLNVRTGKIDRIVTQDQAGANGPISFVSDGVVWGSGASDGDGGEYYFAPDRGILARLDDCRSLSLVVANASGNEVAWTSTETSTTVVVWRMGRLA